MSNEMNALRNYRNKLLADCDWTLIPSSPLSVSKQDEWKVYRQALRDMTKTATPKLATEGPTTLDLSSVTFPTKPS